jgi:hypothetical protein
MNDGPALLCTRVATTVILRLRKTMMHELTNMERLLYYLKYGQSNSPLQNMYKKLQHSWYTHAHALAHTMMHTEAALYEGDDKELILK